MSIQLNLVVTGRVVCASLIKVVYCLPIAAESTVGYAPIFIIATCHLLADGMGRQPDGSISTLIRRFVTAKTQIIT